MTNKEIAKTFQFLGEIMELHEENPFKIRSYSNAYLTLRKLETPLAEIPDAELEALPGVGKAIHAKIKELLQTGALQTLEKYREQTPEGIQEMLGIKGLGPKKIRTIWKELGAESIGELLYACNENRLIELKGFGKKTQEEVRQQLEYYQKTKGLSHLASVWEEAHRQLAEVQAQYPGAQAEFTGDFRRRANIIGQVDILIDRPVEPSHAMAPKMHALAGHAEPSHAMALQNCAPEEFGSKLFLHTGPPEFVRAFAQKFSGVDFRSLATEEEVFQKAGIPWIEPELRDDLRWLDRTDRPNLIEPSDIRGVVHAHTTYSDGLQSVLDMALHAQALGYEYLTITDHSQSAFYANGLKADRLEAQWAEIDSLRSQLAPFRLFKGIESDILHDGSLDYPEDILRRFDLIIASIHSNLRMDEEKATQRLIRAVENPYTHILGHPTGRLLLSRQGYPIDHKKVIDACAANRVAIEINANPYRLDIDHTWIPYALEKGVWISVNPDAHSRDGIGDIRWGVWSARKGGLTREACLNALSAEAFEQWLLTKR